MAERREELEGFNLVLVEKIKIHQMLCILLQENVQKMKEVHFVCGYSKTDNKFADHLLDLANLYDEYTVPRYS